MEEFKIDPNLSNSTIFDFGFLKRFLGANIHIAQDRKMKKYLTEILY